MPAGPFNWAPVPTPIALPAAPLPIKVDTAPEGRTFLMRLFFQSATYAAPAPSSAMPCGRPKAAALPSPSAKALAPEPARVETYPVGDTTRTRLPAHSAT